MFVHRLCCLFSHGDKISVYSHVFACVTGACHAQRQSRPAADEEATLLISEQILGFPSCTFIDW